MMKITMFTLGCMKHVLKQMFSPESNEDVIISDQESEPHICGDCWVCRGEVEPCFSKLSHISVLSANAFNGKTSSSKEILDLMNNNSDKTWPLEDNDGKKANSHNCEFLLVQLVTAKIIGCKLIKSKGPQKDAIELFWNKRGEYPNCQMACNNNTTWRKLPNVLSN